MAEIASSQLEKKGLTVDDVHEQLREIRDKPTAYDFLFEGENAKYDDEYKDYTISKLLLTVI